MATTSDYYAEVCNTDTTLCRCCLSTNRKVFEITNFAAYYRELSGLEISDSDGLPHWICMECCMLLTKSVKFKLKIMKAHEVLYEYSNRCAPFPIDALDSELAKYATPELSATEVLTTNNTGKAKDGFHKVLQHKKPKKESRLQVSLGLVASVVDAGLVKEEDFDYEDDTPLYEYKSGLDRISDEDLAQILNGAEENETKEESKRKRKPKEEKGKAKKTKVSTDQEAVPPKIRRRIDVDPSKIKIVHLNPQQQMKEREMASRTQEFHLVPHQCHLCFKGFNFASKLDNHMRKHSPSRGKYKCNICEMYLPTKYSYNVHMLIHTRRYECLKCGRQMIDRMSIINHYRTQHEGAVTQFTCQLCGKVSSNLRTHRGHLRNHHSGSRPECDQCGKTFINKDSLADHLLIHSGVKNYECGVCQRRFRTRTQVKHHQLKHTDVKDFYCVECDTRFKSAHSLRQHLLKSMKHKDKQSFQFQCERCLKRFESESSLSSHVAIHHLGVREHHCNICGAGLSRKSSLEKHLRSHEATAAPRRFVCHTCGRAFTCASVLRNHARTHTGEKPFCCNRCGRCFTQRTAMNTHIKLVHLKLKRNDKVKPELLASSEIDVKANNVPKVVEMAKSAGVPDSAGMPESAELKEETPLLVYDGTWRRQSCDYFYVNPHLGE